MFVTPNSPSSHPNMGSRPRYDMDAALRATQKQPCFWPAIPTRTALPDQRSPAQSLAAKLLGQQPRPTRALLSCRRRPCRRRAPSAGATCVKCRGRNLPLAQCRAKHSQTSLWPLRPAEVIAMEIAGAARALQHRGRARALVAFPSALASPAKHTNKRRQEANQSSPPLPHDCAGQRSSLSALT